ncbi:ATP-binding protein [Streptomyces vinaceus]|uniref:ATP-binding protein n=1 Tax=Streptomyces vinaceus TaxID=1960 RepID=UPI0035DA58DD
MVVVLESRDRPARQARRQLTGQLERLGLFPAADCAARRRADDAILVASELVTNACRHTSGPIRLTSHWHPKTHRFTVSVTDPSTEMPRPAAPTARGAAGGYGLPLIENLADRWAATRCRDDSGKIVSATVMFPV